MENNHGENQTAEEQSIEVRRGCARGGEAEKKKVSRTAYTKEHPSPNAFVKGQSKRGNFPASVNISRETPRWFSADDETCKAYGLPTHSGVGMPLFPARRA